MGDVTSWRDIAEVAVATALEAGEHLVPLTHGPPLRLQVAGGALDRRDSQVPVLIGASLPVRRGPLGPFWGASRVAQRLGGCIVVHDPTPYLSHVMAYGRTGRLTSSLGSAAGTACWPAHAGVTDVVACLTDDRGHELGSLGEKLVR